MHGRGELGDPLPIVGVLETTIDATVLISHASQRRRASQLIHQPLPACCTAVGVVQVALEPAGLVAPHRSSRLARGDRPEGVEVKLRRAIGERTHATWARVVEGGDDV